jgi:hypothetical protein
MKQRIKISNKEDRETVAIVLIRNGYTVKIVALKNSAGKNEYYVEFEKEK